MRKQKIYLETTMFNYYFDEDRGIAHGSTVRLFNDIMDGRYEAYTSLYVVNELSNTKGEKREKMLGLIAKYDILVLEPTNEAVMIANRYVKDEIIPQKYRTDARQTHE